MTVAYFTVAVGSGSVLQNHGMSLSERKEFVGGHFFPPMMDRCRIHFLMQSLK